MFAIAVPSLIRLVCRPSASEHASESLFASVMKTPEKPASSAARDHSSRRAGGLSGSIVQASAVLAMVNFLSSDLRRHFHQAAVSVKPLDFFDRRIVQIMRVPTMRPFSPGHIPNLEDWSDETNCGGIDCDEYAADRGWRGIRKRSQHGRARRGVH